MLGKQFVPLEACFFTNPYQIAFSTLHPRGREASTAAALTLRRRPPPAHLHRAEFYCRTLPFFRVCACRGNLVRRNGYGCGVGRRVFARLGVGRCGRWAGRTDGGVDGGSERACEAKSAQIEGSDSTHGTSIRPASRASVLTTAAPSHCALVLLRLYAAVPRPRYLKFGTRRASELVYQFFSSHQKDTSYRCL